MIVLVYAGAPAGIARVLIRGGQESQRRRYDNGSGGQSDVATKQGMWTPSRSWKGQGTASPLELVEGTQSS